MKSTVKAPAKINVGLRVLSKRKDGYHNIETIFYPVRLYDIIKLEVSKVLVHEKVLRRQKRARERASAKPDSNLSIKINTNSEELDDGKENICYRATELFFKEFKIPGKYKIKIDILKNIPVGSGLGGGSSDAAAVLKSLFRYFKSQKKIKKKISEAGIKKIAEKSGSDVPYFVNYKLKLTAAYAASRGEKLKPLPDFKIRNPILIVYPKIHISTKWAYKKLKIKNQKLKIKMLNKVEKFTVKILEPFQNDFEKAVFKRYPVIEEIKNKMYECGAIFSSMSGSGSAVYGIFKIRTGLKGLKRFFKEKGYNVY